MPSLRGLLFTTDFPPLDTRLFLPTFFNHPDDGANKILYLLQLAFSTHPFLSVIYFPITTQGTRVLFSSKWISGGRSVPRRSATTPRLDLDNDNRTTSTHYLRLHPFPFRSETHPYKSFYDRKLTPRGRNTGTFSILVAKPRLDT